MNREQFKKRLEDVGFTLNAFENFISEKFLISIFDNNYDYFGARELLKSTCNLYSFDELEQFLIDKGIIPDINFDTTNYLLNKGFSHASLGKAPYYFIGNYNLYFNSLEKEIIVQSGMSIIYLYVNHPHDLFTKESCDKAIGLINYLESIE